MDNPKTRVLVSFVWVALAASLGSSISPSGRPLVAAAARSRRSQETKPPIKLDGLLQAIRIGGLGEKEIIARIRRRGVDFITDAEVERRLYDAGATKAIIDACKASYRPRGVEGDEDKPQSVQAPHTVDEVLDRYVEALGGKAAIRRITSMVVRGILEEPSGQARGNVQRYAKAPNKDFFVVEIAGYGEIKQGYDGVVAWSQDPQNGMREIAGPELAQTRRDAELYKDLELRDLYPKMVLSGQGEVSGRQAYVIDGTPIEGGTDKLYFDAETWLLVRMDEMAWTSSGQEPVPVHIFLDDYREVQGVRMPFITRYEYPNLDMTIKITEVSYNVPIDEEKFNKPTPRTQARTAIPAAAPPPGAQAAPSDSHRVLLTESRGEKYYLLPESSVVTSPGILKAWIEEVPNLEEMERDSHGELVSKTVMLEEFNCRDRLVRLLEATIFTYSEKASTNYDLGTLTAAKGTVAGLILDSVCSR